MHPKRRTALIETLAKGVEQVGPEFERFAGIVISKCADVPMTHAGANLRGYPVAGVVDGESDDGREAIEYSDRRNYFAGSMTKAARDLRKVLRSRPAATQIYLVAGERSRPQKVADFKARVLKWSKMAGRTLSVFGSEEIAAKIVDHLLLDEQAIGLLTPYLADLQRIVDEEAATALVPALPSDTLLRPNVDAAIVARLAAQPVMTISGMGGLGKSIAAMTYADAHRSAYQIRIWLDGDDVKRAETLRAFPLVRTGEPRNIAGLLEAGGCLLVIDDAHQGLSIETLTKYCGAGSHVILTCRRVGPGAYELPLLTRDEARELLDAPGACPPDVFETIWGSVDGHPLCLSLLRAAARSGVLWEELSDDCRAVGKLLDEDGTRLVDRLLARLKGQLQQELSVFLWAGQPAVDTAFLTHEVEPVGVRNLKAYGLTSVDRGGLVRLHDVVFAALRSLDWCDAARSAELDQALQTFIVQVADEPGLRLWTLVRALKRKLEAMVDNGSDGGPCLYALLAVWETDEVRRDLVGDPASAAARLTADGQRGRLAVISVIEAVEQLFLLDKYEGNAVACARLEERMPVFAALAALPELTPRERVQIQHHEGKALKRLNRLREAAKRFEAVLAGPHPMDEARLQLVTIYRSDPKKKDETIALINEVFARWGAGEDVTYSVILGLIERLPAGEGLWRNDIIARHAEAIKTTIVEASNQGVGQGPRAFAPLGRFISTEMPDLFTDIFHQIPEPVLEGLNTDGDRFAWAEIYAEAARLSGADSVALRAKALRFYDAVITPADFHIQRRAELLIDMGKAAEAETDLLRLADKKSSEWVGRLLARTRLALGDAAGALKRIDAALEQLNADHFRSEFLELRYDIRSELGDEHAWQDLERAAAVSQKTVESRKLLERLTSLQRTESSC